MPGEQRIGVTYDGRFYLETMIGRGAAADVYRAVDFTTSEHVAVKVLRQPLLTDDDAIDNAAHRFKREAEVQAQVRHKNVAAMIGSGMTPLREPYLVIELLRGTSLRTLLKAHKRVPPRRAASYVWQALQGLHAVHAIGILHRDLKPANLMLEASNGPFERVVLIDFGFAAIQGGVNLTARGFVVGSLTYLPPERLRGEGASAASDIYAMGIILHELICGVAPFESDDDMQLIQMHLKAEPPPMFGEPDVILALQPIVDRALAKNPADRFATAKDMADELERVAASLPG